MTFWDKVGLGVLGPCIAVLAALLDESPPAADSPEPPPSSDSIPW